MNIVPASAKSSFIKNIQSNYTIILNVDVSQISIKVVIRGRRRELQEGLVFEVTIDSFSDVQNNIIDSVNDVEFATNFEDAMKEGEGIDITASDISTPISVIVSSGKIKS